MENMYIVSFNSTHHAIKSEKLIIEDGLKATTLPTPREVTASCGISIRFEKDDMDKIKTILAENKIEYRGIFCISKHEDGIKVAHEIN